MHGHTSEHLAGPWKIWTLKILPGGDGLGDLFKGYIPEEIIDSAEEENVAMEYQEKVQTDDQG